jgi:hypothetical protein
MPLSVKISAQATLLLCATMQGLEKIVKEKIFMRLTQRKN